MALEYKRVRIKRFAALEERETPESRFWRKFRAPVTEKQPAAVTSIDFSPVGAHDYLITSGTRMMIYDGASGKEKRALTKFKDTVYSGAWRHDGRMVVCGNARGQVQAVQPQTRAALRVFKGHTAPVHATHFTAEGTHIFSAGDDGSLRLWDVPTGACLSTLQGAHGDYIRAAAGGAEGTALAGMIATGGYDHTVKLWDIRSLAGAARRSTTGGGGGGEEEEEEKEGDGAVVDLGPAEGEEGGVEEEGDGSGSSSSEEEEDEEESSDSGSSASDEDGEEGEEEEEVWGGGGSSGPSDHAAEEAGRNHYGGGARGGGTRGGAGRKRPRDGSVLCVDHGEPVTSVTLLPSGGCLITSGSNSIKVWDVVGGGRLLHTIASHAKLVTGTALDGSGTRLLSCGLDGLVKVHELATFTTVHSLRYATPLLSLGIGGDNVRLVVGDAVGGLHARTRPVALGEALREKKEAAVLRGGTYRYFLRGATSGVSSSGGGGGGGKGHAGYGFGTGYGDDLGGGKERKPKLRAYDTLLKGFQHAAALDSALESGEPVVIASVLEELVSRHALGQALGGRTPDSAARIVRWSADYVAHPRYAALCIDLALSVCDVFGTALGTCPALDAAFTRLAVRTREEARLQGGLLGLQGCLDMLMAAANTGAGGASQVQGL